MVFPYKFPTGGLIGSLGPRSVNWHACQFQSTWWPPEFSDLAILGTVYDCSSRDHTIWLLFPIRVHLIISLSIGCLHYQVIILRKYRRGRVDRGKVKRLFSRGCIRWAAPRPAACARPTVVDLAADAENMEGGLGRLSICPPRPPGGAHLP